MKAFEKINEEMQKSPNNKYMEILGHYLIDRCANPDDEALIGAEGKTLKGAMNAVLDKAKKVKQDNVAVLEDTEVFKIVDNYFGLKEDALARIAVMGGSSKAVKASGTLDLADFL